MQQQIAKTETITSKWGPATTCGIDFESVGRMEKFGEMTKRLLVETEEK